MNYKLCNWGQNLCWDYNSVFNVVAVINGKIYLK